MAAAVIDYLSITIRFDYYYPDTPTLLPARRYPDTLYTIFDIETYEEATYYGRQLDSLDAAKYAVENTLFKARGQLGKKLILIGQYPETRLHKTAYINAFRSKGIDPANLKPGKWEISKLPLSDHYAYLESTSENNTRYKYAVCAYLQVSGVVFDKRQKYALAECGWHHRVANGVTGGGAMVLLGKNKGRWEVLETYGLWEE